MSNGYDYKNDLRYEKTKVSKQDKDWICPCCGNEIFLSSSYHKCKWCNQNLDWQPYYNEKKNKKKFRKNY